MASISVEVAKNNAGRLAAELNALINRTIRTQVFVTEGDVKLNIQKFNYIDTGATLNSVKGEMLSEHVGQVSVGTEYAIYGNYGTRYQAARPFFSEAETKAQGEFPDRMARAIEAFG